MDTWGSGNSSGYQSSSDTYVWMNSDFDVFSFGGGWDYSKDPRYMFGGGGGLFTGFGIEDIGNRADETEATRLKKFANQHKAFKECTD